MVNLGEDAETRMTIAAIAAAIVRVVESSNAGFSDQVKGELDKLQQEMRYWDSEPTGVLETLSWFRELISGRFVAP